MGRIVIIDRRLGKKERIGIGKGSGGESNGESGSVKGLHKRIIEDRDRCP